MEVFIKTVDVSFVLLPFLYWSSCMPTVEIHAVVIEDAEHAAATAKTALGVDVVNAVSLQVHVHHASVAFQPSCRLARYAFDFLVQFPHMVVLLAQGVGLFGQEGDGCQHI